MEDHGKGRMGMVVFSDRNTEYIRKMQETFDRIGLTVKIVVLEDDGFLPEGIGSPYAFFAYREHPGELEEKDLFYNFLELPLFWEVRLKEGRGAVFHMGVEKARICFKEPVQERNVLRVEWHMEDGWVYRTDFYNRFGLRYISEFRNRQGKVDSKVYYSMENQERVVEQPGNHIISLSGQGGLITCFASQAEFIDHYRKEAGLEEDCILVVQDVQSLGMLELVTDRRGRWRHILFLDRDLLDRYVAMGGQNGSLFYTIPEEYLENHAGREALILTASDQIPHLEDLIGELPDMVFHIAANTQVSDKLNRLTELENVRVYPQISARDLARLWDICDFYLDINHYREIYDAINTAHEKNLVILGFGETVHHRELMADVCIYDGTAWEEMVSGIRRMRADPGMLRDILASQQKQKQKIWNRLLQDAR